MKILSEEGFDRAKDFLLSMARPLEKAIFEWEFEGDSVDAVLTQLEKFQNPDVVLEKLWNPICARRPPLPCAPKWVCVILLK